MLKKQKAKLPAQELSLKLGSQFRVGTTKMEEKDCFSGLFQELPKGEAFVQGDIKGREKARKGEKAPPKPCSGQGGLREPGPEWIALGME